MQKKLLHIISLTLSVLFASLSVYNELFLSDDSIIHTLLFNSASILFIYLHYHTGKKNMDHRRYYLSYTFILYMILLISLLFIDVRFLRDKVFDYDFISYANDHLNLIPFKTIALYINGYRRGYLPISEVIINLLGNLIAFMPLGFFLPRLYPKLNKAGSFVLCVAAFIVMVEILQLVMQTGVCDVDDLILNLAGAVLIFFITRNKPFGFKRLH